MKIAAIVVIYKNTSRDLEGVNKSLLANGLFQKDLFFSDNTKENLGYGGGINRILKKQLKNYDFFFIVNPDIVIEKDCIKKLAKILKENPNIGIVGPKILDENDQIWAMGGELDKKRYSGGLVNHGKKDSNFTSLLDADFVSGTAMLIRHEVFEKIGLFHEELFLYYEDVDFCLRAKKLGFEIIINPNAKITHFASSTIGKNSPTMQYYMARNHMWIVERYGSLLVKLHELLRMPKTIYQAKDKKYELLGIRDYFLRRLGKYDYWS